MSNDPEKMHASIGALIAMVQTARYALREIHSLSLCVACDGIDIGQCEVAKADMEKLEEIIPLLEQLPRSATLHMRWGDRVKRSTQ